MKFVLATANSGKISEMIVILAGFGIEVVTRDELGIDVTIEETGSTFYENALLKASALCSITGLPSIADDSGLCVDALDGAPGVFTSSFGKSDFTDYDRNNYLLKIMKNMEHREAKFVCNIVCAFPDGKILSAEGECVGEILSAPIGANGFGYDPVFRANGQTKSMAELPIEVKNEISHRGKALKAFTEKLSDYVE